MNEPEAKPQVEEGSPYSRRYLAVRILAAVLIAAASLAIDRLWLEDDSARNTYGATIRTKEIDSQLLDRQMPVKVVVPKGAPPNERGLVVFLHGRGENEASYLVDPMFKALSELKTRAPVMAFPDGGDASFWHDRDSGDWGSYVLDELIPELADRYDIDPAKIAIGGISMGGFGALDLARLQPETFCAVAGHSPTIWEDAGESADGAFDDADDFEANDLIAIAGSDPNPYEGMKVWLDAGNDDPFLDGDGAFEEALRDNGSFPVVKHSDGGHDNDYWDGNWDEYLGWYSHVLRECGEKAHTANETKPSEKEGKKGKPEDGKVPPKKEGGGATSRNGRSTS